jgi:hypothetical protein
MLEMKKMLRYEPKSYKSGPERMRNRGWNLALHALARKMTKTDVLDPSPLDGLANAEKE